MTGTPNETQTYIMFGTFLHYLNSRDTYKMTHYRRINFSKLTIILIFNRCKYGFYDLKSGEGCDDCMCDPIGSG